ncbi:hypothetical protein JTE90_026128 [Oedothorax gibbosus]|uniref:Amyloid protein-binding protein 2 n=1 Tax=Oedothorax gibbosus TaxID=931172 RepID=A0AAV6UZ90_9ARAC|nr:hypothetical protein JTE90_026128 [Oedothorax gibbosus]
MAAALQWIPDSLYNSAVASVGNNYSLYEKELRTFHGGIIFDVYYKLYKSHDLLRLGKEFEVLEQFEKVLKITEKRQLLHNCFQALMDYSYDIAAKLADAFEKRRESIPCPTDADIDRMVKFGFSLGSFLSDAGWFVESESVYLDCLELCCGACVPVVKPGAFPMILECYKRVLHVRNSYCKIKEALQTCKEAEAFIEQIQHYKEKANFAGIYSEVSAFYFIQSNYKEAYNWSVKAIECMDSSLSPREIVNILCNAAKACVVKKQFRQAELLIKQAVQRASERFGSRHLFVANALIDYGYYLLHNDSSGHAVKVYQKALDIRINVLGGNNLLVAIAHEDLAYASYVYEYSSGNFQDARAHVEKALAIKAYLLQPDHFLLPSVKRVNALILEEIAIDSHDKEVQRRLFVEAEEFHTSALQITKQCLGELTVQTGKHYGNLGRLYQSMKKFNKARKMHQRAIAIKKEILGPDDYEVAISMGHLASLYNYDLGLYKEAEQLYLKAIDIGLKQFGKGYSGLEYDYRGLLRVYSQLGDSAKVSQLHFDLHVWKNLHDQTLEAADKTSPFSFELDPIIPEEIYPFFLGAQ